MVDSMKLLSISNGHGEDVIALRILMALRRLQPAVEVMGLAISGTGSAYRKAHIPLIAPTQQLPSGGFLNRDPQALVRDLGGGLVGLTRSQLAAIKQWSTADTSLDQTSEEGAEKAILAVGDIVPQIFAYRSGLPHVFMGTAKSEYWLRDEKGKLSPKTLWNRLEGWSGSVYLPWERWLMTRSQCCATFVRDQLTADCLQALGVKAFYQGNPMMDGLTPTGKLRDRLGTSSPLFKSEGTGENAPLTLILLTGSRAPEAYRNWDNIIAAIPGLMRAFADRKIVLLAAIAPSLSIDTLKAALPTEHWLTGVPYATYQRQNLTLHLIPDAYSDCLHLARAAIATAGTATEQFVGLGKPVFTLPGEGPQFTRAFAQVQAKMLGEAVEVVCNPNQVGKRMKELFEDEDRLRAVEVVGKRRMGRSGAGERIAREVVERFGWATR